MQAMKGATVALGSMNKSMNLPQLQRIAMEFERENDIMDQRQEMMDDAIDDAMDVGAEEEGDEVVEQVLEEIGVDLSQQVCCLAPSRTNGVPGLRHVLTKTNSSSERRLQAYRPAPWRRVGWPKPKPSEAEVVAEAILATMIFRLAWTASGDDFHSPAEAYQLLNSEPLTMVRLGEGYSFMLWSCGFSSREASVFTAAGHSETGQ